jgi:class 3 adenylate cyclase/HAMP domain-containing protein
MWRRWNSGSRLWRKQALAIGALVTTSLLGLGLTEMTFSYREAIRQVARTQAAQGQEIAYAIRSALGSIERQLEATTALPWEIDGWLNTQTRREEYQRLLRIAPAVERVRHLAAGGTQTLTVSRRDPDQLINAQSPADGLSSSPRKGALQCVYSLVSYAADYEPLLTLTLSSSERGAGQTLADINLRTLAGELKSALDPSGASTFVTDSQGHIVLARDTRLMLDRQLLPGADGGSPTTRAGAAAVGLDGQAAIRSSVHLAELGWTVHIEQLRQTALAPVIATMLRAAAFIAVGVVLALGTAAALTTRLTAPVLTLGKTAALLGAGDLTARANPRTRNQDELDELANTFNHMADNLQESYANLEQKVADKTRDLAHANAELSAWSKTLEHRVDEKVREVNHLSRLKRFFSPNLVAKLTSAGGEDPLHSHRQQVSVLFADLRGFTAFADRHHEQPERVMEVLSEFHGAMGELIYARSGTLERFTGDGMMVFFNDPEPVADHADQAVLLGQEMQAATARLSAGWRARDIELSLGVGISTGTATLGAIGFRERIDYAAIGMVTNVAARLCAEARAGETLVSQEAMDAMQASRAAGVARQLVLKGVSRPVTAYLIAAA